MLFAQFFDDFGSAGRNVAEDSRHVRARDELVDHSLRKTSRISWKRALENDSGHLPMTSRGVLAIRFQRALAVTTARIGNRRDTGEWTNIAETEVLQIRQLQLPRVAYMPERV